nr:MAG TPA: hypothetical protein [Caudoviricetes sp.]
MHAFIRIFILTITHFSISLSKTTNVMSHKKLFTSVPFLIPISLFSHNHTSLLLLWPVFSPHHKNSLQTKYFILHQFGGIHKL